MRYFGGKYRISKHLCKFLNSQLTSGGCFVDLFCGSCNVVSRIRTDVSRFANDKCKNIVAVYQALQVGWEPPDHISEDEFHRIKKMPESCLEDTALRGFVGFGLTFAGDWWAGYAHSRNGRDYCRCAKNSALKKSSTMQDVVFTAKDYAEVDIPEGSIVYCDIPYKGMTQYRAVGAFDHEKFYAWCKSQKNCRVLVSEYKENVPDGATIVWEHMSRKDVRNSVGEQKQTIEVVFEFKEDM